MKAKEFINKKKEEVKAKIENIDSEELLDKACIAGGIITAAYVAYGLGRWRAAKYATGLMCLAREAGIMSFDSMTFYDFITKTPQKVVFKDWKRILKMD